MLYVIKLVFEIVNAKLFRSFDENVLRAFSLRIVNVINAKF